MPPAVTQRSLQEPDPAAKPGASARYPLRLLAVFLVWRLALAIAPVYRQGWLLVGTPDDVGWAEGFSARCTWGAGVGCGVVGEPRFAARHEPRIGMPVPS